MLEINKLTIIHKNDNRRLLEDFSFVLNPLDKVALIGEEGNGKSTLLKAVHSFDLVNDYVSIKGTVNKLGHKTAYLHQELPLEYKDLLVWEYFNTLPDFYELNPKEIALTARMLELDKDIFYDDRKLRSFSGGEIIKLELAYLLFQKPDILLLDEPSNNLDLNSLNFLESFIKTSKLPIMYVSHDETLIENTANIIIHLELLRHKTMTRVNVYKGKYIDYINERRRSFDRQDQLAFKENSKKKKKEERYKRIYQRVDHELNTISRQNAHGGQLLKKKMHATKAFEKRLLKEKEELTEYHDEEEAIMLKFEDVEVPNNKKILDLHLDKLVVADKVLSENIDLKVYGKAKIAIIGNNGLGKSTLLKVIRDNLKDLKGVFYMPQDYEEVMDFNDNALHFIDPDANKEAATRIRNLLGSCRFTADEMLHPLSELSGGQKAKLFFIKMIYQKSEILLLDEPTRNFSPLSNPVIYNILKEFKGVIIAVSHDRLFLKEVFDVIYELRPDGLKRL